MTDRIVVLLDMDCFYVQVEERHYPNIKGLPAAVVQYNSWKGGGIIAVNYEARDFGVKRGMRGDEARSKCQDIQLVTVPVNRGKADLTRYRDAGKEVINVLCDYSDCVERASIDEAYIDFTKAVQERIEKHGGVMNAEVLNSTWVVGYDDVNNEMSQEEKEETRKQGIKEWLSSIFGNQEDSLPLDNSHPEWDNIRLAHAAALCEEMRAAVLERTGFKCSAGIAHNKMLGKLSCGLHKPNQQTIIPQNNVEALWKNMPVGKVRNLGGKLGDSLTEDLCCNTMGDLAQLSFQQLTGRFENKTAEWLYNLGRGIDTEPVTSRQLPKSIGCGKNFNGKEILNTQEKTQKWMLNLAEELTERLNEDQAANKRRARTLTVSVRLDGDARFTSLSRSANLPAYCTERITRVAISLIQHTNKASPKSGLWTPSIRNISLSAGKFEDWTSSGSGDIQQLFKKARENPKTTANVFESEKSLMSDHSTSLASPAVKDANSSLQTLNSILGKSKKSNFGQIASKSPKKSGSLKSSPIVSNSFFKNLLQKRVNHEPSVAEDLVSNTSENHVNLVSNTSENHVDDDLTREKSYKHELEKESNDGTEVKSESDLDILVSCLSDEEKSSDSEDELPCGQVVKDEGNSDSSVYDADTDIDSSFSGEYLAKQQQCQDHPSQKDLVYNSNDTVDKENMRISNSHLKTPTKQLGVGIGSDIRDVIPGNFSSVKSCQESLSSGVKSLGNVKVSVKELFPDLGNVDDSVLSMLPKEMKLEVEKALKDYNSKIQEKKSGMWKYVTSIPSPHKTINPKGNYNDPKPGPSRIGLMEQCSAMKSATEDSPVKDYILDVDKNSEDEINCCSNSMESEKDNFIKCEECGDHVSPFEIQEHTDYHVAVSLQSSMRKDANLTNKRVVEKNLKSNSSKKRTKGGVKPSVAGSKMQKLDSFFKL